MKEKVQNTRGRGPVELCILKNLIQKQEAMSKEAKIKLLTRRKNPVNRKLPTGAKIKSGTLRSYGINFHP